MNSIDDTVDFAKLCNYVYVEAAKHGTEFYQDFLNTYQEIMPEYKANAMLQAYSLTLKQHKEIDCKGNIKYYNGA